MKKILSLISALAVILSISACGGEEKKPGTENKGEGGKVTQVIFGGDSPKEEEGDTSAEAIEFLKENHPYYYENFYEKRSKAPLTFVSSTSVDGADPVVSEIYVKDDDTMAVIGFDALGRKTRILYDGKMGYQIYDEEKKIYSMEYGKETVKQSIENTLMKLKYSFVSESGYNVVDKEFNGKSYICYMISSYNPYTDSTATSEYYFNSDTNEPEYIVSGSSVSEILEFSDTISDESIFDIPTGYTEGTVEALNEEIMAALSEQQEQQAQ